jgi:hypothetical protein
VLLKLLCRVVRSAAEHAPAFFVADFQPISVSRSAEVSATFSGQRPVPPLDEDEDVLPPLDDVLPPDDDVLPPLDVEEENPLLPPLLLVEDTPPLDDVLPPDDDDVVLPPLDDVLPPDELLPDEVDFPFEEVGLPLDEPLLDEMGSVPASSWVYDVVVVAVHASARAEAEAATTTAAKEWRIMQVFSR